MWPMQLFAKQINIFKLFLLLSAGTRGLLRMNQAGGRRTAKHLVGHTPRSFSVLAVCVYRIADNFCGTKFSWFGICKLICGLYFVDTAVRAVTTPFD